MSKCIDYGILVGMGLFFGTHLSKRVLGYENAKTMSWHISERIARIKNE